MTKKHSIGVEFYFWREVAETKEWKIIILIESSKANC